jgi:hypothetical protein
MPDGSGRRLSLRVRGGHSLAPAGRLVQNACYG